MSPTEQPALQVRHNEPGSVSISRLGGGHVTLTVQKQSRLGDIEAKYEVDVEPNSLVHVTANRYPVPEGEPPHNSSLQQGRVGPPTCPNAHPLVESRTLSYTQLATSVDTYSFYACGSRHTETNNTGAWDVTDFCRTVPNRSAGDPT